jgi:hypothetical protein
MKNIICLLIISSSFFLHAQEPSLQWAKQFGGDAYIDSNPFILTNNNELIYTGSALLGSYDFDPGDSELTMENEDDSYMFVTKLDVQGNLSWIKTFSSPAGSFTKIEALISDESNNLYLAGSFEDSLDLDPGPGVDLHTVPQSNGTNAAAFIIKLDSNGNYMWGKSFGEGGSNNILSIHIDNTGDLVMFGNINKNVSTDVDPGNESTFLYGSLHFLIKWDTDANFKWAEGLDLNSSIYVTGQKGNVKTDQFNNIYLTDIFTHSVDFDPGQDSTIITSKGSCDTYILKLNSLGEFLWVKILGSSESVVVYDLEIDKHGNPIICGMFQETVDFDPGVGVSNRTADFYDAFIWKLDQSGNLLFYKTFEGPSSQAASSLSLNHNAIYVCGTQNGRTNYNPEGLPEMVNQIGKTDIFIAKLDSVGNNNWVKLIGGSDYDFARSIVTNSYGDIYCRGIFRKNVDFDPNETQYSLSAQTNIDYFLLKLNQCELLALDTSISFFDDITLQANESRATYQWVDCSENFTPLADQTNQRFIAPYNGEFASVLTYGSCIDTTSCEAITHVNIHSEKERAEEVTIYPNPSNGEFTIQLSNGARNGIYRIYNPLGELIIENNFNNSNQIPIFLNRKTGHFLIEIIMDNAIIKQQILVID